ncbi:MAG: hypothetical protein IT555_01115 [Acetobacteraceae bacterium]|nr:hypothetical protein [Acetobacteraceae bacterium]
MFFAPLLSGCVSHNAPGDLAFSAITLVDWRDHAELAGPIDSPKYARPLLKVEFTSAVNLVQFTMDNSYPTFGVRTSFCGRPSPWWGLGWPWVYWRGVELSWLRQNPIEQVAAGSRIAYDVFLNVSGQVRPADSPTEEGYDLRHRPQDICLSVGARDMLGFGFESNTVVIPKEAIAAALRSAQRVPAN